MCRARSFINLIILLGLATCTPEPANSREPTMAGVSDYRVPDNWHLPDILGEAYGSPFPGGEIFAWMIMVDNRPWCIESLIAVVDNVQLTHLYRSGIRQERTPKWTESEVLDEPDYVGSVKYLKRPTQSEFLQFLDDTWWSFPASPGWNVLDAGFDLVAWRNLTGEDPPARFLKQIQPLSHNCGWE